ncbi:MAG: recombinase family protein [Colwellia sp.]|nr:recombinase family protein [Colwellia sp.]
MSKVIFSYCRVSTSEQSSHGMGLDTQKTANLAAINRLIELDPLFEHTEDIIEVGSAYSGKNLSAVLNREYEEGSIIVMFDQTRFSREDSLDSLLKLRDTVRKGLSFYFSSKSQLVNRDNTKSFADYVAIMSTGAAANEESNIKSERSLASYYRKVVNGENIYVGRLPNWLEHTYDTSRSKPIINGFKVKEDRRTVIETIYNQYISGVGATGITKLLNETVEPWSEYDNKRIDKNNRVWRESYVSKLLVNRALIGERVFYKDKNKGKDPVSAARQKVITDYYPPAITLKMFYQAEDIRKNRSKGSSGISKHKTNFYSGLVFCGYCGSKCGVQNFNNGRSSTLRCTAKAKSEVSTDICAGGTSGSRFLEQVLIEFCSDKINWV